MVNTIVFHAEADAAAAAQIATMLSARRKPLTYCVTGENAAASAQLRMGAQMIALALIGPHLDPNTMRRVLAPALNGRRRALLLMPGVDPPDDIVAAAPSVALHGEHAADAALLDNIERYASAMPQRTRASARSPVFELATASPRWAPPPDPRSPAPRPPAEFHDTAVERPQAPKRLPVITIVLCAAAAASLGFFAWRTYDMQRTEEPRRPTFFAPAATSGAVDESPVEAEEAAPPRQSAPVEAQPVVETAPATRPTPEVESDAPVAATEDVQASDAPAPLSEAPELRGREAQGPDQ